MTKTPPILSEKHYGSETVFTPENLLCEARRQKGLAPDPVPEICLLDPHGDILRALRALGDAQAHASWACYPYRGLGGRAGRPVHRDRRLRGRRRLRGVGRQAALHVGVPHADQRDLPEAAQATSVRSMTTACAPRRLKKYAIAVPMTPPPMINTRTDHLLLRLPRRHGSLVWPAQRNSGKAPPSARIPADGARGKALPTGSVWLKDTSGADRRDLVGSREQSGGRPPARLRRRPAAPLPRASETRLEIGGHHVPQSRVSEHPAKPENGRAC